MPVRTLSYSSAPVNSVGRPDVRIGERPAMINQKDLAERLQLSQGTISKALRGLRGINAETRARVLDELTALGIPHPEPKPPSPKAPKKAPAASAEPVGSSVESTRYLGVLSSGATAASAGFVLPYYSGLHAAADALGIPLVWHQVPGDGRDLLDESTWPAALRKRMVDGLVLVYRFDPEVVRALAERFPVVTVTHWAPGAHADHVEADPFAGMARLVDHLAERGHRRVGYVMHTGRTWYEGSRYAAFVEAWRARDPEHPSMPWLEAGNGPDAWTAVGRAIKDGLRQGITAWMADSDGTVSALLPALTAAGVRVPDDISLTGFDDFAQYLPPMRPVTTVQTPTYDMGTEAVRLLIHRIQHPQARPVKLFVDTPLVIGETTGPAPGGRTTG